MSANLQHPARPVPLRPLIGLTVVVLLGHVWVLEKAPLQYAGAEPFGARAFITRTLNVEATTPPARPALKPAPTARARAPAPPMAAVAPIPLPELAQAQPQTAAVLNAAADTERLAEEPAGEAPTIAQVAEPQAPVSAPAPAGLQTAVQPPIAVPAERDPALTARNYAMPGSVRLKFNATGQRARMEYNALGEMLWLHDGKDYEARLELSILFSKRTLTSTGRMTADGLAPTRFSDRFRSEQAAHFERDRGRVSFSANTPESPLLPGAQDQLSVFVQLAALLGGDPLKFPAGTSIAVQTIGPRAAEPWVFVVEDEELLYLPGGQQATRKLVRTPRKDFDQKVEIWLAPALSWLPARIRITQPSGDFIDQQWRSTSRP